jgi:kumamolisin
MTLPIGYTSLKGSKHVHPKDHKDLGPTAGDQALTVTVIVRRPTTTKLRDVADFSRSPGHLSRQQFAAAHSASDADLSAVQAFARSHKLDVVETNAASRSVVLRGAVSAVNHAFGVELHDYQSPRGRYRGYADTTNLPSSLADRVEAVIGLDNRPVHARRHYATASRHPAKDPPATTPLTPQQVATLYSFPTGDGSGQTIGIYEMQTEEGSAGYTRADLVATMGKFGGKLTVPTPIDVSVDGVANAGVSDGETVLDITVASAVAQAAKIAVYFTGGTTQSIIHALQRMIHPGAGDPEPTILSISYGWGPDDTSAASYSDAEYAQMGALFQDAANLGITVLVSSGDSGAFIEDKSQAQASYPATEPWVTACGGTTIGSVAGMKFAEYAWNDSGATGGGVSGRFPIPSYQSEVALPRRLGTNAAGRGIPDIAGNASPYSGYPSVLSGKDAGPIGGTSAVAPLYAGLFARINANLKRQVGFVNPKLYTLTKGAFRDVSAPPGPANNSYGGVTGYPVAVGWDACTGAGSVTGVGLQEGL